MTGLGFLRSKAVRRILLAGSIVSYLFIMYLVLHYSGIGCVFLYAFGIPCPGCGMTRAAFSLLRLDIIAAWRYNPLIFAMPYVFTYILFDLKPARLSAPAVALPPLPLPLLPTTARSPSW